jgi:hypothetical protein
MPLFERALELAGDVDRDEDDDATKRDAQGPCLQRTDAMTPRRSPDGAPRPSPVSLLRPPC